MNIIFLNNRRNIFIFLVCLLSFISCDKNDNCDLTNSVPSHPIIEGNWNVEEIVSIIDDSILIKSDTIHYIIQFANDGTGIKSSVVDFNVLYELYEDIDLFVLHDYIYTNQDYLNIRSNNYTINTLNISNLELFREEETTYDSKAVTSVIKLKFIKI